MSFTFVVWRSLVRASHPSLSEAEAHVQITLTLYERTPAIAVAAAA
jgi:hypothetical protein